MKYKIGKNEELIQTLSIDDKDMFIITFNKINNSYTLYCIDDNNVAHKKSKGDNPLKLEEKSGYRKMCEEWWANNE